MEAYHHWMHQSSSIDKRNVPVNFTSVFTANEGQANVCQVTLYLIWISVICLWGFRLFFIRKPVPQTSHDSTTVENGIVRKTEDEGTQQRKVPNGSLTEPLMKPEENGTTVELSDDKSTTSTATDEKTEAKSQFSKVKPPPTFDCFLKYCILFGGFMLFFYLCDSKHIFPIGEREYSRDLFMFLCLLLFAVACYFTIQVNEDKILNRDQTEEWKGWMQVMFVWYHYFHAIETYNLIRIYIACYVWMTGFGNFSFFWVRQDFSVWRVCKMMFRLNFLVIMVALTTNNQYMLYYICAMHTYWFVSVYVFMRIFSSWNEHPKLMAVKFFAYLIFNALIFDVPNVADIVFAPFWPVLSYKNSLHEWKFRAGLDHYATLVGMICAYNYPNYERFMKYLDQKHIDPRDYKITVAIKVMSVGILSVLIVVWYDHLMFRDKYEYNRYHPYTSWFPIMAFIFMRNLVPVFRTHHIGLFAWLGKITLETYISQLHIYMQFNATQRIMYITGYPLMNLVVATLIYLFVSYYLFKLTTEFSAYLLPKDMKKVLYNFIGVVLVFGLYFCVAFLLRDAGVL